VLSLLRSALAVIAGFVVGAAVNFGLIWINSLLFPDLAGLDMNDSAAVSEALSRAPPTVWVLVLLAHAGHALVGAWLAAVLAGRARVFHGLIVGALVLLGGVVNLWTIRPPAWFAVVDLALYLPAAWLGAKLAGAGRGGEAAPR
jgi:hypothetical protein